jgi:hypothetical protein
MFTSARGRPRAFTAVSVIPAVIPIAVITPIVATVVAAIVIGPRALR